MHNEDVPTLRLEDYRKTTERPPHPSVTTEDTSILSFASAFHRSTKASLVWVSDCPPLALVQKPEGEMISRADYTSSFFQSLREVDMFRRQSRGLSDITPDAEMRRAVKDLPIDELFIQLKEGRDDWRQHPELYAAIADEICHQIESADVTTHPAPQLQLFSGNGATDTEDQVAEELAVEQSNYLTG